MTIATVSRQNALNGETLGESPLVPMSCPVKAPQSDGGEDRDAGGDVGPLPDGWDLGQASLGQECLRDPEGQHAPDPDKRQYRDHDMRGQDDRRGSSDEGGQGPARRATAQDGKAVHREDDRHGRQAVQADLEDHRDGQRHGRQEETSKEAEQERAARCRPGHASDERAGQRGGCQQEQRQDDQMAGVERSHAERS